MARIRSIKPEFSHDEVIGRLSLQARLLFILLWPICDDAGRFRASPVLLRSECFPYDAGLTPETVDSWLQELTQAKRVRLYEVDGQRYGVVVNFLKHQRIEKPSAPKIPPPPGDSPTNQGVVVEGSVRAPGGIGSGSGSGSGSGREGKGNGLDGRGGGGTRTAQTAGASEPPPAPGSRREDPEEAARLNREAERTLAGMLAMRRGAKVGCSPPPLERMTRRPLPTYATPGSAS